MSPEYRAARQFLDWVLANAADYGVAGFVSGAEGPVLVSHFPVPDQSFDQLWAKYQEAQVPNDAKEPSC